MTADNPDPSESRLLWSDTHLQEKMQLSARISLLNELKGELGYVLTLILTVVNATKTKRASGSHIGLGFREALKNHLLKKLINTCF